MGRILADEFSPGLCRLSAIWTCLLWTEASEVLFPKVSRYRIRPFWATSPVIPPATWHCYYAPAESRSCGACTNRTLVP
ncbi:hypothetical protein BDM02DRAFT_828880 [Thelephora ganbajun]|uniref:Uncharacterized protein n=1 Tax=Thelephora ganbajun TaxID=370292 RepID=A0ACB6Z592_THEGA|nr:hypothetical protein BDM02DRAFT_828880 [Thelephora ganbajun]